MPIEVNKLSYSYKKGTPFEKQVLKDISLFIKEGEFVGIIGPTQAGKTTLAQHFNALLIPGKGSVVVNNMNTADKNADLIKLRHNVGYVFQNPDYQLFAPTVGEDIAFGPRNQNLPAGEVEDRVVEAMDQVGLDYDTFYKRDIFALSGGQKRRAAIAGVLACKPQIMILDDVTAGLDPGGREEIIKVIQKLHIEKEITTMYISNSMDEVAVLADRTIVLDQGQVLYDDQTRDVFSHARKLIEIGLELPEVMGITTRLAEAGFDLPGAILNIEEAVDAIAVNLQQGR